MNTLILVLHVSLVAGGPSSDLYSGTARQFVEDLAAGRTGEAHRRLEASAALQLPAPTLGMVWAQLTGAAGAWESIHSIRSEDADGMPVRVVRASLAHGGLDVRLVFTVEGQIRGVLFQPAGKPGWRKPDYVDMDAYTEEEREIPSPLGPLPATLSLPRGTERVPALVLVHGSGPHDRDEAIGPNKPFRDLSAGLASRSIAVLRYEKRTRTHGARMKTFTLDNETVDDAVMAARLLQKEPRVESSRIFILGHSQGGYGLPRIAKRFPDGAGWIALAANARPIEDLIVEQVEYILSQSPLPEAVASAQIAAVTAQAERVRSGSFDLDTPPTDLPAGFRPEWFLDVRDYRPTEEAAGLPGRWLFLQGGRDYQVTRRDLEIWEAAFKGRSDASFKLYPDLNHLFYSGEGPCTPAEYNEEGSVAVDVIEDIATFILR